MCGGQCQCFDSICNAQITWRTCRSVLNTFQSISEKRFDNSKKTKPEKKKINSFVFFQKEKGEPPWSYTHTSRQHTHVSLSQELFFVFPLYFLGKKKTRLVLEKITPNKLNWTVLGSCFSLLIVFHKSRKTLNQWKLLDEKTWNVFWDDVLFHVVF